MKKILGTVLAAAMLANTATTDIGYSYKGFNYFTPSGFSHLGCTDCLSMSLTTEAGGVIVAFDTTDADTNIYGVTNVDYRMTNGSNDRGSISLVADKYYGWMNFALPLGQLQLTGGQWSGRNVNRVLTNRGDLDERDFELFKPGVINGIFGADSANLTNGKLAWWQRGRLRTCFPVRSWQRSVLGNTVRMRLLLEIGSRTRKNGSSRLVPLPRCHTGRRARSGQTSRCARSTGTRTASARGLAPS